ncbi:hypothetical protein D6853_08550 [Butyrivibrio sp. X503]|uniref:hypothetical protein n=1 Tax=Butyrivibrio sp. X503 TaxID=2364878 RepID=UPI000EAA403A|nr:hypothetical protein [Butyrivibrio sp. X503]RKM55595.1 hypothetical protein D6853_08550 [Butyrivibrio sp. X503]
MNKRKTAALLMASIMMLTMMGCGTASSESSPETGAGPTTDIDAGVSTGLADMPSVGISADLAADIEASSVSAISTDEPAAYASLPDDSFLYKGNVISVLNDVKTTIDALGKKDSEKTSLYTNENLYSFDSHAIEFETYKVDGEELPKCIYVIASGILTPKNICVGCSKDEVIAAYGEPNKVNDDTFSAIEYNFDDTNIVFDIYEEKVDRITIENVETSSKVVQ